MSEIGKRIKMRRQSLGMTQDDLSKRMGYRNKSTIAKIEIGVNDIPQSKVVKFAEALNTTVSYLMGWEEETDMEIAYTFRANGSRAIFESYIDRIERLDSTAIDRLKAYIDAIITIEEQKTMKKDV